MIRCFILGVSLVWSATAPVATALRLSEPPLCTAARRIHSIVCHHAAAGIAVAALSFGAVPTAALAETPPPPTPLVREVAPEVRVFDDELASLSERLAATMYAQGGVGMAAPQLGVSTRMLVYNANPFAQPLRWRLGERILVNPVLSSASAELRSSDEGCLSVPNVKGAVARPTWAEVDARTVGGAPVHVSARGVEARLLLHEMDHLDGKLFTDRVRDGGLIECRWPAPLGCRRPGLLD
jgi:peptide deformylase